jgi:hypothetical protein
VTADGLHGAKRAQMDEALADAQAAVQLEPKWTKVSTPSPLQW